MRCRRCGHDLTVVASNRCPECGEFFDPNHPRTYLTTPVSGLRALAFSVNALLLSGLVVTLNWLIDLKQAQFVPGGEFWDAAMIILVGLAIPGPLYMMTSVGLAGYVCWMSGRALTGKDPWQTHANLFPAALAIALSSVMVFFVAWTL